MAYGTNAPFGLRPFQSISGGSWTEKTNLYQLPTTTAAGVTTGYTHSIFQGDLVVFNTSLADSAIGLYNSIGLYPALVGGDTGLAKMYADGTPSTIPALTSVPVVGVFISCEYFDVNNRLIQSTFWPSGNQIYPNSIIKAYILDDPDTVFDVQVSTPINATNANVFAASPVFPDLNTNVLSGAAGSCFAVGIGGGQNFNTVPSPYGGTYANNPLTGSIQTGQSGMYLMINTSGTIADTNPANATAATASATHDYAKISANLPLKVIGLTPNPKNIAAPGLTITTTPFLNVRVMINNHAYRAGTGGVTFVA